MSPGRTEIGEADGVADGVTEGLGCGEVDAPVILIGKLYVANRVLVEVLEIVTVTVVDPGLTPLISPQSSGHGAWTPETHLVPTLIARPVTVTIWEF